MGKKTTVAGGPGKTPVDGRPGSHAPFGSPVPGQPDGLGSQAPSTPLTQGREGARVVGGDRAADCRQEQGCIDSVVARRALPVPRGR